MKKYSKLNEVMETRDHSKNGAIPKSHKSRGNFLIMLLSIFFICFVFSGCDKEEPEVQPYDVTLVFGQGNYDAVRPENIEKVAAQKGVGKIILETDGKSWSGMPSTMIKDKLLKPAFEAAPGTRKEGKGNLKDVEIGDIQDSIQFVEWGFTVNQ
jgi:hypothetical protein